jgi:hypothetical protein
MHLRICLDEPDAIQAGGVGTLASEAQAPA